MALVEFNLVTIRITDKSDYFITPVNGATIYITFNRHQRTVWENPNGDYCGYPEMTRIMLLQQRKPHSVHYTQAQTARIRSEDCDEISK